MKVTGVRAFTASRRTVWDVLNDPSRMAKTMPGVEGFEVQDDTHWSARVKIPLGLGGLKMSINFEKTEERPPDYAKLVAKGQGVGALMQMTTEFELDEAGEGTSMRWEADVRIAGAVGAMGQRVLQPIVNQQVQQVLAALEKQIEEAAAQASPAAAAGLEDAGPPAEADAAAGPPDGTSGAGEGLNPLAPESYDPDAEGPTTSTEDG
jgi:carbon monoxide dehydrogenase subunit G